MKWDMYESEFIEEWKSEWSPNYNTESLTYLLDDPYLEKIIYIGLSDGRIRGAISRNKALQDIYDDLCRSKKKRKPEKKRRNRNYQNKVSDISSKVIGLRRGIEREKERSEKNRKENRKNLFRKHQKPVNNPKEFSTSQFWDGQDWHYGPEKK